MKTNNIAWQIERHLKNRKADNAHQSHELVKAVVSRSCWCSWLSGRSSLSVAILEHVVSHLGLRIVIVDRAGKTATGRDV